MKSSLNRSPRRGNARRLRRSALGFTLLEVLVSVVVLSFGVLGVVGMQAAALRANKQARFQSAAVRFARELSDMMRENKQVATAAGNPYLVSFNGSPTATPPAATDCSIAACTTSTVMAQFQLSEWLDRLNKELPGARVVVCFDSTSTGASQWACDGNAANRQVVVKVGWTTDSFNSSATGASAVQRATDTGAPPLVVLPLIPGNPSL